MTLDEFVSQGWNDHGDDAAGVFARLPDGVALVAEAKHHPALAALVTHVSGEHLGRWADGLALLDRMMERPGFDASTPEGKAVLRSKAVLARCAGDLANEARWEEASRVAAFPEASNRIRVLAVAAAAYLGRRRIDEARRDLEEALALASYGPDAKDPAARALAVTCNNMASDLETRPARDAGETDLMLRAADLALRFWRLAGGPTEELYAEYRLAMSHIAALRPSSALAHAERALAIARANAPCPADEFFAHEAVCRARRGFGDAAGAQSARDAAAALLPSIDDAGTREWCASELAKLDA